MILRSLTAAAALLASAPANLVPRDAPYLTADGRVRVVGYNDMDQMLPALGERFSRDHPGVRFDFVLKGTRTAPAALTNGTSAFAPMGAEFEPADLAAWRRVHSGEPLAVPIAHDSLHPSALSSPTGILVHASNPMRRMTMASLRRVVAPLAGERPAMLWRDLGVHGALADKPIRIVGLAADTAIGALTLRRIGAADYRAGFEAKRQSRDVAAVVAVDPTAIGIANLNHVTAGLRALAIAGKDGRFVPGDERGIRSGHYPLDRTLLIYVRRDGNGRVEPLARAFLDLALSPAGQAIIASGSRKYLPLSHQEIAAARVAAGLPE
ncbi:MAG: substrate-binding domain-containing protein [Pseudomonadota bacterium]